MTPRSELRVLLIEDSDSDAGLVLHQLEIRGFELRHERVENAAELEKALEQDWDVIVSDFRLPQFNAIAALQALKDSGKDIPFIIVSQAIGEDVAVELMRAGAADYIMKSSLKRLGPAVEREIREAHGRAIARANAAALETSERNFRLLAENSGDMISRHAPDGTFTYVSPAFERLLGYKPQEQIGHSAYEFFHPEDLGVIRQSHNTVSKSASETRVEYRLLKKDGSYLWVQSISRSLVDPATGLVTEIQVTTRDISMEREARAQLAASENRYRNLTTNLQVGVLIQGPRSEILLGNAKAYELLGLSEDQLLGKTSIDPNWNVIREDGSDFSGPMHPVPQAIQTKRNVRNVVMGVYRPATNDRLWLLVDAMPNLNADGSIEQVVCTFTDITERKLARQQIEAHEAFLSSVIESQINGVVVVTPTGEISVANQAAAEILELKKHQVTGRFFQEADYWKQVDNDYHEIAQEKLPLAIALGRQEAVRNFEHGITFPDGRTKWLNVSASPLKNSDGSLHGAVASFTDITDRRAAAQKLRENESFLEAVVDSQLSGTVVVDPLGKIRLVNRSAEVMLQMRRDATGTLIDDTDSCYFVDMESNRLDADNLPIAKALREKTKIDNVQFGVVFARGNMKWLSASASPLRDQTGKLTGAVGSYLDITEIIETQRRNKFQLQQLKLQEAAINNSKNGIIIADARLADMPVIYVNRAFTDITGYESHEVLGRNCRFLHAADKEQAALTILRRAISTAQATEVLLRNFRKDGRFFYSKLHLSPVLNEAGQVAYFVAVQTDVTDKFLIDKQIEIGWERMQLALRGAKLGLIDVDYEANETYYSSRFAEIVGYTSAELSATISSWRELVHPDDLEDAQRKTEDHLAGRTDHLEAEVRFHHKNGSWVWVLCRGKVVDRGPKGPRRFVGTILDINERKESERKIQDLTQNLMKIAEVERAEISSELHDVVGQSLVLLKLNVVKFLQGQGLRSAENEQVLIDPIADTLQKVRDISRRLTPSHMEKVGLGLALEDMLQGAVNLSGVRILWNLNALDRFFPGNWNIQVFRIVQEALTNALKHATPSEIRVETRRLEENLEILIVDNGNGFCLEKSSEGLGLSILRERVRGLRGHIFWESGSDGTSVHILLPAQGKEIGSST